MRNSLRCTDQHVRITQWVTVSLMLALIGVKIKACLIAREGSTHSVPSDEKKAARRLKIANPALELHVSKRGFWSRVSFVVGFPEVLGSRF